MAITLVDINLVKQKCRLSTRRPSVALILGAMFEHMVGKNLKDLAIIPFDQTTNTDTVIADVPCTIYAVVSKKAAGSTTASWTKLSNGTSVVAAGDIVIPHAATDNREHVFCDPDGIPFGTAAELADHTAVDGTTDSNDADASAGFVIIGAAT